MNVLEPANRLRAVRESRGITRSELARRVGLATSTIAQAENPLRSLRATSLRKFSAALGVDPRDLVS